MDLEAKKAANITNAIQGVAGAAGGIADGIGGILSKPKEQPVFERLSGAPTGKITDMVDKGDYGLVNGKIVRDF